MEALGANFTRLSIVDSPPTITELKRMVGFLEREGGSFKQLFNTSGEQYRTLKIAEKIKAGLTEAEALSILSENGKLIKRPFLLTKDNGTVGFKAEKWQKLLE